MKRLRISGWSEQLLQARPGAAPIANRASLPLSASRRSFCVSSAHADAYSASPLASLDAAALDDASTLPPPTPLPSPHPSRAHSSAKLAALHARLALPPKVPLEALARALVCPSADRSPNFNNGSLAYLGSTIINFHVLEYLVCKWPRLPTSILYETLRAYAGSDSLLRISRRWGVDAAAAPGEEVDPGLLQWGPGGDAEYSGFHRQWGYSRSPFERKGFTRRGMSSRIIQDNDFGDQFGIVPGGEYTMEFREAEAHASLVKATVGVIYAHCGREAAKEFVRAHILSRIVDPSTLFEFKLPTRELALLCAREGFEAPLARLESETGRLSRTPVFVVGIYSGNSKLAEGAGASLDTARRKASMNALKAWYLYSPGNKVRVPSDMMDETAKPWKAPYIDIGEII